MRNLLILLGMTLGIGQGFAHYCSNCESVGYELPAACEATGCRDAIVVTGEYLYWQAEQTGMTYALGLESLVGVIADSRAFRQEFDWGSGFRVGLGYDFACVPYGINLAWTRYHNTFSGSESDPVIVATELLANNLPLFIGGTLNGGTTSADWTLDFDMIDLDFGTCVFANQCFSFSPYVGLKGGWIHQKQKIYYNNFLSGDDPDDLINSEVDEVNKFSGVGPKVGFQGNFGIWDSLSLIGNFSTALLYGFDNHPHRTRISGVVVVDTNHQYSQQKLLPTVQMVLGLAWDAQCFNCCRMNWSLGYEVQYFWNTWRNQNSLIQDFFITDAGYGDLMFQGVTAQLAISF